MATERTFGHNNPTSIEDWTVSDQYHNSFLITPDCALTEAKANSQANGLPDIAVSAAQGKLLGLLAHMMNARRILEVGTLGGYVNSQYFAVKGKPADNDAKFLDDLLCKGSS